MMACDDNLILRFHVTAPAVLNGACNGLCVPNNATDPKYHVSDLITEPQDVTVLMLSFSLLGSAILDLLTSIPSSTQQDGGLQHKVSGL
jgi:hypothetical protein